MSDSNSSTQIIERFFSLKSIFDRKTNHIEVVIPDLQRGLVWNPKQVEFLWDSILRGFPIGGFVLSESDQKNEDSKLQKYYLMDGQQRFNAIEIGFTEPSEDSQSLLWIDIEPAHIPNTTRKYFIKATTIAHPWGYHNEDDCKRLSADERHEALITYDLDGQNIYKDDIKLIQTFPYDAKAPIPFAYILNSLYEIPNGIDDAQEQQQLFVKKVLDKCDCTKCLKWKEKKFTDENIAKITRWLNDNFETLLFLKKYEVTYNLLPSNIYENENNTIETQEAVQTDLEILFQRLNTGGTKISNDDLIYSAIKAYWGSIKEQNEKMAKGLMPPQNLIQIIFRLLLTDSSTDKFVSPLNIKTIRNLSKKEEFKEKVIEFYNDNKLTDMIRKQLLALAGEDESCIPKYVLMKIIKEKPDIILFTMFLIKNNKLENEKLIGLVLFLYWFSLNTNDVINCLYQRCRDTKNSLETFQAIKEGIIDLTYEKKIENVYSRDDLIKLENQNINLRDCINNTTEGKFINKYMWYPQTNPMSKLILLYAQRKFLLEYFSNFNPADTVAWEDHNCPWDYDHIFPQNKVNTFSQHLYQDNVKFWLWSIGNFAAIPFEKNRSKGDDSNYEFYKEGSHKKDLLYSNIFESILLKIDNEEEKSKAFETVVFGRMIELYKRCYKTFEPFVPKISGAAAIRKENMILLKHKIKEKCNICDACFYFVREPNDLQDYELKIDRDWFRFCISLKTSVPQFVIPNCMISFTWNHFNGSLEFGLRWLNTIEDRKKYVKDEDKNNIISKMDAIIKDCISSDILPTTKKESDSWWYLKYKLNLKEDSITENLIEQLATLYVNIFKSL